LLPKINNSDPDFSLFAPPVVIANWLVGASRGKRFHPTTAVAPATIPPANRAGGRRVGPEPGCRRPRGEQSERRDKDGRERSRARPTDEHDEKQRRRADADERAVECDRPEAAAVERKPRRQRECRRGADWTPPLVTTRLSWPQCNS
jgi:hypothetical protein